MHSVCVVVRKRLFQDTLVSVGVVVKWPGRIWSPCRSFSVADNASSGTPLSKRRQFKAIPVNQSLLNYIETVGVGIPPRRKRPKKTKKKNLSVLPPRISRALPRRGGKVASSRKPPQPFGPSALPVKIIRSVASLQQGFPDNHLHIPEIALVGRSNVGKSTLLNALLYGNRKQSEPEQEQQRPTNNKSRQQQTNKSQQPTNNSRHKSSQDAFKLPKGIKAAISNKPGETRLITFYQLQAKREEDAKKLCMWLVDLPGYGFAHASPETSETLAKLMQTYLLERSNRDLKRVLFLLDARHGMKKADLDFLDTLQQASQTTKHELLPPLQVVLTKCDLVPQPDLARRITAVRQQLSDALRRQPSQLSVMLVSAAKEKGPGVLELQKELAGLATRKVRAGPSKKK